MRTSPRTARSTIRPAGRAVSAIAVAALALLAACGAPESGEPAPDGAAEYHVHAGFEERDGGGVVLCIGPMPAIDPPPPCGGPAVVGLDWDDVPGAVSADGVTSGRAYLVGTYSSRTLTLTRPPEAESPLADDPPDAFGAVSFDPLCADPWRGGDEVAAADPTIYEAMDALVSTAQALPGYAASYVSDGLSEYNVIVSAAEGDAEAAHATLREVWPGWLCVVEQDLPTAADVAAAQSAVHEPDAVIGVLHSGSGADGVLDIGVEVADDATLAAIHEAVAPWLTPAQVRVTGVLQPLP